VELIFDLDTADAFHELIANRPGILSPELEADFVAMAALEGFEPTCKALATLVKDARRHPRRAWNDFQATWKGLEELAAELEPESARIDAAVTAGAYR
jgi:hypothetical protein